jgi:hypothetical protein
VFACIVIKVPSPTSQRALGETTVQHLASIYGPTKVHSTHGVLNAVPWAKHQNDPTHMHASLTKRHSQV